jgi:hypothetical protein
MCNVKENVSRHLYTYSVSINVALSKYLNVSPFLLIGCVLENVDFMFSLLHVYLYNLYNCHKLLFNDNTILNLKLLILHKILFGIILVK